MKINQIPDLYIEQYLLGELPDDLRIEMDRLAAENKTLKDRMEKIRNSDTEILKSYPAAMILPEILMKSGRDDSAMEITENGRAETGQKNPENKPSLNNPGYLLRRIGSLAAKRYTLSLASAAAVIFIFLFMLVPGMRNTDNTNITYDTDVRIKGLDSRLIICRIKGNNIEELKNSDTAGRGDILQIGYTAAGNFRYGTILSIDGRGTVTLHYPADPGSPGELTQNRLITLDNSYELDDSPDFERFIMVLSAGPLDINSIIEKAKKLAMDRELSLNGSLEAGGDSAELSIVLNKTE